MLATVDRERDVAEEQLLAGTELRPVDLDDRPSAARRVEELEAEPPRAPGQQVDLASHLLPLLLETADVRQLRLGLLRLVLLGAEALDEALESRDVDREPLRLFRGVGDARRLLPPPLVPWAAEIEGASALEL